MLKVWAGTGVAVIAMALAGCGGGDDSSGATSGSSDETQKVAASADSKLFGDGDQVTTSEDVDAKPSDVVIGRDNIRAGGELARKLHECLISDPALQEVDTEIGDDSYGSGVEGSDAQAWSKSEYASPNNSDNDQDVYVGYGVAQPSVTVGRFLAGRDRRGRRKRLRGR